MHAFVWYVSVDSLLLLASVASSLSQPAAEASGQSISVNYRLQLHGASMFSIS
jgi:hypothetical protein